MGAIESAIRSGITPLVAGGCHNKVNRSTTITKPYVVFHEVEGEPINGISGYLGKTMYRFEICVFADSPEQAKSLALGSIKTEITGSSLLQGVLTFQSSGDYDEDNRTFEYVTEYEIGPINA